MQDLQTITKMYAHIDRYVFLDTETTGISPKNGDKMVEIGAVEIKHRQVARHFHTYLNPQCAVSDGAFRVHGLSNQFLADKPLFADKIQELLDFVDQSVVVIHNATFDLGFLNHEAATVPHLSNFQTFADYTLGVIDSLQVARLEYPGRKNSLDALCDRLEVERGHRSFHGALLDAHLLAQVWLAMTRCQESLFKETHTSPPALGAQHANHLHHQLESPSILQALMLPKNITHLKIHMATEEENQQHINFIKNRLKIT